MDCTSAARRLGRLNHLLRQGKGQAALVFEGPATGGRHGQWNGHLESDPLSQRAALPRTVHAARDL